MEIVVASSPLSTLTFNLVREIGFLGSKVIDFINFKFSSKGLYISSFLRKTLEIRAQHRKILPMANS
jgi:hypothetical protein